MSSVLTGDCQYNLFLCIMSFIIPPMLIYFLRLDVHPMFSIIPAHIPAVIINLDRA